MVARLTPSSRAMEEMVCRSNIELRGLSGRYAAWWYSLISPVTTASADGSQVGYVPDGLRFDVWGPLTPGLVRPVAVVMDQVLAEHQGQVTLAEDQDPVQQLTAEGPDDALADGVHPWRRPAHHGSRRPTWWPRSSCSRYRRSRNSRTPQDSPEMTGQAKGILMERYKITGCRRSGCWSPRPRP
jgi:hypothetical protein